MHPLDTPTLLDYCAAFVFSSAWPKTPASGGELDAEQCLEALLLGVWMSFVWARVGTMESTLCCAYAANQTCRDYRPTTGSIDGNRFNRC